MVEPWGTWTFKSGTLMWNLGEPELLRVEPCGTWFQISGGCPKPPRSFIGNLLEEPEAFQAVGE